MEKITIDDPDATSGDLIQGNMARLKAIFPEAFTEDGVDFDVLKQLLGGEITEQDERYGLNWHGKRQARQVALTPSTGTLLPCPEDSVEWDSTQNLLIEGDNLEVLKLLQKSYSGKIKAIYIDPPYNTGKDFVYRDDFKDNIKNYLQITSQIDGGRKITSNVESSGRFHTDWLNMMYPRLRLARNLLRKDGVIFISIDDKELHHLRIIADEIFGEENFVSTISVVTNLKGRNDKSNIATSHEYIVMYAMEEFVSNGLPLTDEQKAAFKFSDENGNRYALRDLRKRGGPDRREDRPNMFFPIYWNEDLDRCAIERSSVNDVEILPMRGDGSEGRWRWGKEKVSKNLDWLKAKRSDRKGRLDVEHRVYLNPNVAMEADVAEPEDDEDEGEVERTSKPKSIWLGGEFSSDSGKRALKEFLPGDTFDFPKSVDLIRTLVLLGTSKGEIFLDFFAGSATTAQAVMAQNAMDGWKRRYMLVQLPEPLDPNTKEQKAAAAYCDEIGRPRNLVELTKERLRKASNKFKSEAPLDSIDVGFRIFKLSSSNIRAWNPDSADIERGLLENAEHLVPSRSQEDVLFELLLKLGLDLCVPIETRTIADKAVYSVGGGALFACLADGLTPDVIESLSTGIIRWRDELAPAVEPRVVFKDSGFSNDIAKANMAAILNQNGLSDVRSL